MSETPDFNSIRSKKINEDLTAEVEANQKRAERLARRIGKYASMGKYDVKARTGRIFSEANNSSYGLESVEARTNELLTEQGLAVELSDKNLGLGDYQRRARIIYGTDSDEKSD